MSPTKEIRDRLLMLRPASGQIVKTLSHGHDRLAGRKSNVLPAAEPDFCIWGLTAREPEHFRRNIEPPYLPARLDQSPGKFSAPAADFDDKATRTMQSGQTAQDIGGGLPGEIQKSGIMDVGQIHGVKTRPRFNFPP